jgi:hypothetical protein
MALGLPGHLGAVPDALVAAVGIGRTTCLADRTSQDRDTYACPSHGTPRHSSYVMVIDADAARVIAESLPSVLNRQLEPDPEMWAFDPETAAAIIANMAAPWASQLLC